jgi:transketolase
MRAKFAEILHNEMSINKDIYLLTADLGYKMWDKIRDDFPDRFFNVGASEQLMIGVGVGLAMENKIPLCYSVTSFLLKRPYEFIDIYLNHEKIPVKLVGGGLYEDYGNLGYTHYSNDVHGIFNNLSNIKQYYPSNKDVISSEYMKDFLFNNKPSFIGLRR